MKCPLCKGMMVEGFTTLPYELTRDKILVVRDVPSTICNQCGETFIEIAVTKKVEKVVATAEKDGVVLGFIDYRKAA